MKLAELQKQHQAVEAACAECTARFNDSDKTAYQTARVKYRTLYAAYLTNARKALRDAGGICVGMPCLPWNSRGAFFQRKTV